MIARSMMQVIADPDIYSVTANMDDLLLIVCDGLVEKLTQEQVSVFARDQYRQNPTDPAQICTLLLDYSLRSGSKDNMSAMLIAFRDGTDNAPASEFRAGPFTQAADDRKFVECYMADGRRAGIEPDELVRRARQVEKEMQQEAK